MPVCAASRPWLTIDWQLGDALAVDRPDRHFDGAVMAYGLRNLADPGSGLRELRRLLHHEAALRYWISIAPQVCLLLFSASPFGAW